MPAGGSSSAASTSAQQKAPLRAYLEQEANLKPYQADRVLRELEKRPVTTVEWLKGRMTSLAAAFGPGSGIEVAAAVYNGGLDLLDQDAATFPKQLVQLKEVLAGAWCRVHCSGVLWCSAGLVRAAGSN